MYIILIKVKVYQTIYSGYHIQYSTEMVPAVSAAAALLSRRSVQCSFSSVFHLRKAGMNEKDFQLIKNVFTGSVIAPLILFGGTFVVYKMMALT